MSTVMRALLVAGLASLAACATARPKPPDAALAVVADDPRALVWVDDRLVGTAGDLAKSPLPVRSGFHRVVVKAEGKLSAYREADVRKGEQGRVSVELRPDLDAAEGNP